jgi:3-deoxy-7-phosphoheptulonate synthase
MNLKNLKKVLKQDEAHQSRVWLTEGVAVGQDAPLLMVAGPCAVESEAQLRTVSESLVAAGVPCLRGGAFKPRTSPYSFQGLGLEGLRLLDAMRRDYNLAVITEVMCVEQVEAVVRHADCLQIGSRNMQNFDLLKAVGRASRPVLLKRGLSATLEEFLNAAEYILAEGNPNVILCERGIRSFDSAATRNVFDLGAVALLRQLTHLPVVADPSHATGRRSLIERMSLAAVAAGADGLLVEAHPQPEKSVSDADQALSLPELHALVEAVRPVAEAVGRALPSSLQTARPERHASPTLAGVC